MVGCTIANGSFEVIHAHRVLKNTGDISNLTLRARRRPVNPKLLQRHLTGRCVKHNLRFNLILQS